MKLPKFLLTGIFNTIVNFSIMFLLINIGIFYVFASSLGFLSGALVGFTINTFWTFDENFFLLKKFYKYLVLQICNLLITISIVTFLVEIFFIEPMISQIFAIIFTTMNNYYVSSRYIFTQK